MKKAQKPLKLYKKVVSDLSVVAKGGLVRQEKQAPIGMPTNNDTMCYICPDNQGTNW